MDIDVLMQSGISRIRSSVCDVGPGIQEGICAGSTSMSRISTGVYGGVDQSSGRRKMNDRERRRSNMNDRGRTKQKTFIQF